MPIIMSRRFLLLGGLVVAGCATPAYVKTAYDGDLQTLGAQIRSAAHAGKISRGDVEDLAVAVARREVRSASGKDVLSRIGESRACVRAVEPELRERAEVRDSAGASAMLVLVEAGRVGRGSLVDDYVRSDDGAWRAVAARATAPHEYAELRRTFYVDPDERVRHEALLAALEARDSEDLPGLLETARLDPDPANRSTATRAVGSIGGPDAMLGLRDLWAGADPTEKLAIVEAWSMPATFSQGGADALVRVAESGDAMAAVAAAGALARIGKEGHAEGRAALARAVREGTTDERLVAIDLVPVDDDAGLSALDVASKSDDAAVRIAALARMVQVPARRTAALGQLEATAAGNDAAARQARLALASAGDPNAAPLLERDLGAGGPTSRARAATALFRLGKPDKMAPALADPDPTVRMSIACSVLGTGSSSG